MKTSDKLFFFLPAWYHKVVINPSLKCDAMKLNFFLDDDNGGYGAGAAAIFTCQYAPFSHNNNNKSNIPCMENFPRITVVFWCCTGCSRQSLSQRGTLHQQQSSLAFWDKEGKKLDLFMSHCLVFTAFVWKWRILNYCKLSVSIPLHRELLQQYNYSKIEFEFV